MVLIIIVLQYSLKSRGVMSPNLFFFLKITLAICGLLWVHTNFRIVFSVSVKNVIGIVIALSQVYRSFWALWVVWTFKQC